MKRAERDRTTRIIDGITAVYATLNQVKAALKNHLKRLVATEGAACSAACVQFPRWPRS